MPKRTLAAAARSAADLLGAADRVGSVQPGRFADLVATPEDPLQDIRQWSRIGFYRRDGAPTLLGTQ